MNLNVLDVIELFTQSLVSIKTGESNVVNFVTHTTLMNLINLPITITHKMLIVLLSIHTQKDMTVLPPTHTNDFDKPPTHPHS